MRDRQARVDRFQEDASIPLFLVSLKAGGQGLNLTAADYVYLLDPWWNPAVEAQAIDRTHRIGQTRRVFAYRLMAIARGEKQSLPGFEEKDYVENGNFDERSLAELLDGLASTRRATLALVRGLDDAAWNRRGLANDNAVSVRALAWVTAGHERHHLNVLRERYGVG